MSQIDAASALALASFPTDDGFRVVCVGNLLTSNCRCLNCENALMGAVGNSMTCPKCGQYFNPQTGEYRQGKRIDDTDKG